MNDRIQKVKNKLLELGYIDNEWLAKYLEILEANLNRARVRKSTQAHHAIPVNSYWTSNEPYQRREAEKLSRADDANFEVHLLYKDHLLIHSYLTLCTDLDSAQQRYEAQESLRKANSRKGSAVKPELVMQMPRHITEEKILNKLANYTSALELAKKEADEKADHKYRTLVAQWKSKYKQYLADPEKYTTKKSSDTAHQNNLCHENSNRRQELRQLSTDLHNEYINLCATFPSQYYARKDPTVKEVCLLWKQAVAEYNSFCANLPKNN